MTMDDDDNVVQLEESNRLATLNMVNIEECTILSMVLETSVNVVASKLTCPGYDVYGHLVNKRVSQKKAAERPFVCR